MLLEKPEYQGLLQHDVVYGFVNGLVGSAPLARYRLPSGLREHHLIAPSCTHDDGLLALPQLAAISHRIAPWLAVHVVPTILCQEREGDDFGRAQGKYVIDGARYSTASGLACYDDRLVLMVCSKPMAMASTLFHEIFHHIWHSHLSDAARDLLTAAVAQGAAWPGKYYDSVTERTARLFQAWAWSRLEGLPQVEEEAEGLTINGIFEMIWTGELADHQIQHGLVDGHEALRVRRGLPALPPTEPEVVEPEVETHLPDATDDAIALLAELAATTGRFFVRVARWAWHGSAAA